MKSKTFTLIEILLASLLLANIGLAVFFSFHMGVYLTGKEEDFFNNMQGMRIFLRMLERDLRSVLYILPLNGKACDIQFCTIKDDKIVKVNYFLKEGVLKKTEKEAISKENGEFKFKKRASLEFISNVENLTFFYYDSEKNIWLDSWDKQGLPSAVKIILKIKFDKRSFFFSKFVKIPAGIKISQDTLKNKI